MADRRPRTLTPDAPNLLGASGVTGAQTAAVADATAVPSPDPLAGVGTLAARLNRAVVGPVRRLVARFGQGVVVEREVIIRGDGNAVVRTVWSPVPGVGTSDPTGSQPIPALLDVLSSELVQRLYGAESTVTVRATIAPAADGAAWPLREGDRLRVVRGAFAGRAFRIERGSADPVTNALTIGCREVAL